MIVLATIAFLGNPFNPANPWNYVNPMSPYYHQHQWGPRDKSRDKPRDKCDKSVADCDKPPNEKPKQNQQAPVSE